ncbi:hypothetical protein SAMN04488515_0415 [Cognatiyoonia koreensis]|uniref:Uncharacterized protein n=1 Tax=Cognatiyoonia koreensis TaxID=364200 RepID=A0A1I0N4U9_9RHOB|nr:hypothetical protein [Cognatiyoonia koreensis]SEV96084.1 hypothetical protein SAMN04488515_0415 [Cognatiyoonia koreensis]
MTYRAILACGAFGGMCPSIAKLASVYSTNPDAPMPVFGAYLAMGLFAFLGGGIALGFGAREVKAAIIAGIAAPGIVTNIVSGAAERQDEDIRTTALTLFATPAYAQVQEIKPILIEATGRVLTITPQITGGQIGASGLEITFENASGMTFQGTTLYNAKAPFVQVVVPDDATVLVIGSKKFPLPADASDAQLMVETSPTLGGDLLWALGGDRRYAVGNITVTFGH